MTQTATAGSSAGSHSKGMHEHPIGALAIGLLILFFALWGVSVQLTTSEAWFTHGAAVAISIAPHFSILAQPVDFFQGRITGIQSEAFTYAWGMEVIQFLFSTGVFFAFLRHNRLASWICIVLSVTIMILDSVADFQATAAASGWQQLGFTLIVFMMAFGLLYAALYLIIIKGILGLFRH